MPRRPAWCGSCCFSFSRSPTCAPCEWNDHGQGRELAVIRKARGRRCLQQNGRMAPVGKGGPDAGDRLRPGVEPGANLLDAVDFAEDRAGSDPARSDALAARADLREL